MTDNNTTNGKGKNHPAHGLSISILNYIFIISILLLALLLFIVSAAQSSEYEQGIQITDNYQRLEKDSRMVQNASDYLTRSVQYFVMTGEKRFLNDYFTEANDNRRREKAIDDLKQMTETDSLIHLLEKSVEESMNLMQLEYVAMRYAAEGYGLDLSTLPLIIQNITLPDIASTMTDQEKIIHSREMIFSKEYSDSKDLIAKYDTEYLDEASTVMTRLQKEGRQDMKRLISYLRILTIIIVIMGAVLFYTIARMVVSPLKRAVHRIADGNSISPINGTYEIQYMSNTYNIFHRNSMNIQKQLKIDADRDVLTGVLNRRGFLTVTDRLSLESFPLALLVLDVDNFKTINDTYGHSVGDQALIKIARLLLCTFRNTDITSRIGGDEFTVILSDVTSDNIKTIENKINNLNHALQNPEPDDGPVLSVSVGCAFSDSGYNEHLFNEADAKLYDSKDSGGGKISFACNL